MSFPTSSLQRAPSSLRMPGWSSPLSIVYNFNLLVTLRSVNLGAFCTYLRISASNSRERKLIRKDICLTRYLGVPNLIAYSRDRSSHNSRKCLQGLCRFRTLPFVVKGKPFRFLTLIIPTPTEVHDIVSWPI